MQLCPDGGDLNGMHCTIDIEYSTYSTYIPNVHTDLVYNSVVVLCNIMECVLTVSVVNLVVYCCEWWQAL